MSRLRMIFAAAVSTAVLAASSAFAQSHPEYVQLGRVSAALYKPDSGPAPHVAFLDAHPGNPVQALRDLNPSVVMKEGKITVIAELDPFSEANGYNPKGPSHYSAEFQAKYYAAQSKAMSDRLARVLAAEDRIKKGE